MKRRILVFALLVAVAGCLAAVAQQKAQAGKEKAVLAKAASPAAAPSKADTPKPSAVKAEPKVNADLAYKANCSRCHAAPRKFSERAMVTIMRHMRVRANLTEEETKAILQYLTE